MRGDLSKSSWMHKHCFCKAGHRIDAGNSHYHDDNYDHGIGWHARCHDGSDVGSLDVIPDLHLQLLLHHLHHGHLPKDPEQVQNICSCVVLVDFFLSKVESYCWIMILFQAQ